MPCIEVDGARWFYAHQPGAPDGALALVLIHGAGGSHLVWPAGLRRLEGAAVYALDLPGHGRSGGQGCDTIRAYAQAVAGWLDALGLERAVFAGHSMGGAIALQLGLSWPARVAGLVLLATGARLPAASSLTAGWLADYQATLAAVNGCAWGPDTPEALVALGRRHLAQVEPRVARGDYAACAAFDLTAQVRHVCVPSLVVGATADRLTPPELAVSLAQTIPGAQLCLLEGAGHMVMIERADQLTELVRRFLQPLLPAPAAGRLPGPSRLPDG